MVVLVFSLDPFIYHIKYNLLSIGYVITLWFQLGFTVTHCCLSVSTALQDNVPARTSSRYVLDRQVPMISRLTQKDSADSLPHSRHAKCQLLRTW